MHNIMVTEKYEMHIAQVSEHWQTMRIGSEVTFESMQICNFVFTFTSLHCTGQLSGTFTQSNYQCFLADNLSNRDSSFMVWLSLGMGTAEGKARQPAKGKVRQPAKLV